jgi:hypothetical protein
MATLVHNQTAQLTPSYFRVMCAAMHITMSLQLLRPLHKPRTSAICQRFRCRCCSLLIVICARHWLVCEVVDVYLMLQQK